MEVDKHVCYPPPHLGPMKITALEEYGLRCVLRVAQHGADEPISASAIAEMEGLSQPYTQKLLRQLSDSDVIGARRGPNGGYYLAAPLETISLGDVMRELGGMLELEEFCETHTGQKDVCSNACQCTIRPVWSHISTFLSQVLDNIPLEVLIEDEEAVERYLADMQAPGTEPAGIPQVTS